MRVRASRFLMATLAVLTCGEVASACHTCQKTPCVLAPVAMPAYQCVTEMVPYTVYKQRRRIEYQEVAETIMVRVPETTYIQRQRCINKPVWDTQYIQRAVTVCRPVHETTMVDQQYTVCKPVSTTRQVTEYCMQPSTSLVTVPVVAKKCGHTVACGCQTVAQTTFTPVPVVKDVVETHMVAETLMRQVPVTRTHMVQETKIETVPIRSCRIVPEIVTERIPVTTFHCEPKVVTRRIPHPVCETVAETCYKPVKHMVPVTYAPAPQMAPAPMPAPAPSMQGGSSQQG